MKSVLLMLALPFVLLASPVESYMEELAVQAKSEVPNFKGFSVQRGENIFTSEHIGKKGKKISCVSCHGKNLRKSGENIFTGKVIEALSPTANPKRLSKLKDIKKWLRRNFKDVYKREGTAVEKGDVLRYIQSK